MIYNYRTETRELIWLPLMTQEWNQEPSLQGKFGLKIVPGGINISESPCDGNCFLHSALKHPKLGEIRVNGALLDHIKLRRDPLDNFVKHYKASALAGFLLGDDHLS